MLTIEVCRVFSLDDIVSQSIGIFSVKGQILTVMQTRVMTVVSDVVLQKIWPSRQSSNAGIIRQKGLPRLLNTFPSCLLTIFFILMIPL